MGTPVQTGSDIQPRELADLFRTLGDAVVAQDREIAGILHDAQHRLEALAWNRWGARTSTAGMRARFTTRHKCLKGAAL